MPDPRVLRRCFFIGLVAAPRLALAVESKPRRPRGSRVAYSGGTLSELAQGADGLLQTTDPEFLVLLTRHLTLKVRYGRVNLLEYGQTASRRYALAVLVSPIFLLSKKRTHFLTIGFQDDEGKQQALVFIVAKEDIRTLLASLEARTGQQVEFQDEEARRAGKG